MSGQPVHNWHMDGRHTCPGCGCRMIEVTTISYTFDEEHLAVRVFIDHEKKCRREERGVCAFTVLVNINDWSVVARVH